MFPIGNSIVIIAFRSIILGAKNGRIFSSFSVFLSSILQRRNKIKNNALLYFLSSQPFRSPVFLYRRQVSLGLVPFENGTSPYFNVNVRLNIAENITKDAFVE